jgi:hypothetical protein
MQSDAQLTIAIPTYNRAGKLQAQLERLAPQLSSRVQCRVYDNASTDATGQVAALFASRGVSCFRSPHNYGAERNFLRCFEDCQTEWLWILSDDDPLRPDAVKSVLELTGKGPFDLIQVSATPPYYREETVVTDPLALLDHSLPGLLNLISLTIYRMPAVRPLLSTYIEQITTMVAQLAIILKLLESGQSRMLLSPAVVLDASPDAPRWSTLRWIQGMSMVLEFTKNERLQKRLATALVVGNFNRAFLLGLREAVGAEGIRRWKRTYSIARHTFSAYAAFPRLRHALRHFYRAGQRRECGRLCWEGLVLALLRWSPGWLFRYFAPKLARRAEAG